MGVKRRRSGPRATLAGPRNTPGITISNAPGPACSPEPGRRTPAATFPPGDRRVMSLSRTLLLAVWAVLAPGVWAQEGSRGPLHEYVLVEVLVVAVRGGATGQTMGTEVLAHLFEHLGRSGPRLCPLACRHPARPTGLAPPHSALSQVQDRNKQDVEAMTPRLPARAVAVPRASRSPVRSPGPRPPERPIRRGTAHP